MSIKEKISKIEKSHHQDLLCASILNIQLTAQEMLKRDSLCRAEIVHLIGLIQENVNAIEKHYNSIKVV